MAATFRISLFCLGAFPGKCPRSMSYLLNELRQSALKWFVFDSCLGMFRQVCPREGDYYVWTIRIKKTQLLRVVVEIVTGRNSFSYRSRRVVLQYGPVTVIA